MKVFVIESGAWEDRCVYGVAVSAEAALAAIKAEVSKGADTVAWSDLLSPYVDELDWFRLVGKGTCEYIYEIRGHDLLVYQP